MRADETIFDPDLARRLPLPLAQLYRRAHNARTDLERHLTAFYLWEAGLKLLAAVAISEYARHPDPDPKLAEALQALARPALGHWWQFVRLLLPVLAERGDEPFRNLRDLLLGRARDDFPHAAGLDVTLREALEEKTGARATVRFTELFDRLVQYRNVVLAHAAPGRLKDEVHRHRGSALLAGAAEVLGRLDPLAGRRLLYVAEVRQAEGLWLVQHSELLGENERRLAALELPRTEAARLPDGQRVYLEAPQVQGESLEALRALHPLLWYDAEAEDVLFLNARRGRKRTEYLSYVTGRTQDRPDLGREQCRLLARVLGMEVEDGQVEEWAGRLEAGEPPAEAPAEAGRRVLGEFELLSELGRGGMGVVYRAWQPSLRRQVALKKLLAAGDAATEARFRREIRALGRVEHPNLVKVFTSGAEGDQWFYAMELVEGAPMSAVCDTLTARTPSAAAVDVATWQEAISTACQEARRAEKPLSDSQAVPAAHPPAALPALSAAPRPGGSYVRQVVGLVRQAAEAAHALHEAGVLHRDIKPGNVMVSADGGQAVLMDLGLAQLADDEEGRLTRTRQFVGTLRYASPEQLGGARLDRRADLYSLGATLWELLALRPLFGVTEQTPTPDLILRAQQAEPERLRKINPAVSRDLEAVVHKCLEKDPARRYPTAQELAEDLGRYLAGEAVRARPVRDWERAWKWARRRPALTGLLLALALALAAGTGVSAYFAIDAAQQAEEARDKANEARDKADEARKNAAIAAEKEQEAIRQREQTEVTLADSLLRPVGHHWNGMDAAERDALAEMACLKNDRVRLLFIERALAQAKVAERLGRRSSVALHAVVGLDSGRRRKVSKLVVAGLGDKDADRRIRVACALVGVALGEPEPAFARKAAAVLVERVDGADRATGWPELVALVRAWSALAGRLPEQEARSAAIRLLRRVYRWPLLTSASERAARADAEAALVPWLAWDDVREKPLPDIVATLQFMRHDVAEGPDEEFVFVRAMSALAGRLDDRQVRALASILAERLTADRLPGFSGENAVADALSALAGRLRAEDAQAAAAKLAAAMGRSAANIKRSSDLLLVRARVWSALAARVGDEEARAQAQPIATRLAAAIDNLAAAKDDLGRRDHYVLATTAPNAAAAWSALVAPLGSEEARVQARPAAARLVAAMDELAAAMDKLATAGDRTSGEYSATEESFVKVVGAWWTLASRLGEQESRGRARAVAARLAAAMERATNPYDLARFAGVWSMLPGGPGDQEASAVARKASASLAAALCRASEHPREDLAVLARAWSALVGRLGEQDARAAARAAAGMLAGQMENKTDRIDYALAKGWATLARKLTNQEIVDYLKYPWCAGPIRESLLGELGRRANQRFDSLWDMVAWVQQHDPDIDLTSPPRRPGE